MSVKPEKLLSMFEELSVKLNIKLVHEKGSFEGGSCVYNDQEYIVINKSKPIEQRLKVLATSFHYRDLSDKYLVPVLRSFIDEVAV